MKLPSSVKLIDVCLRDGLQNVQKLVPLERKRRMAEMLIDAGFKKLEAASFVSPRWIPQMADASELIKEIKPYAREKGVQILGLVPNLKGLENAIEAGVDGVSAVISVSELHNRKNVNRTQDESFTQLREMLHLKPEKMLFRLSLATVFGCPFGEEITLGKILSAIDRGLETGVDQIVLSDTIGSANPVMVEKIITAALKHVPAERIVLHFHDTQGLAIANILTAMQLGLTQFESSAAGLGGCPYAPGASGNAASEDLNNMMLSMGVATGIDQTRLMNAVEYISNTVPACTSSHIWDRAKGTNC